jgi:hypothetical protein
MDSTHRKKFQITISDLFIWSIVIALFVFAYVAFTTQ